MTFTKAWQAVADAYDVDLAIALRGHDWTEVEHQRGPNFGERIQAKDWVGVGDDYNDLDSAHLIRDAFKGDFGNEDDVLDASERGDKAHLSRIASKQNQDRIDNHYAAQDRQVGMP